MTENTHNNAPPPPIEGRWKPGQSGNPKGRPVNKPVSDDLKRFFAKLSEAELSTYNSGIIKKAAMGDVAAWDKINDRLEGKVPAPIGGTEELGPVRVAFGWMEPERKPE